MNRDDVLQFIIEEIRRMAANETAPAELAEKYLDADTKLADLALDSLGKMSLLAAVEDYADIILSEGDLMNVKTLGDLAGLVSH
jgi:acyl carrier protein